MLINGVGLLGFRDPHGIRPLVFGKRPCTTRPGATDFIMASESVAIDTLRFSLERDVGPGEAILITLDGTVHAAICAEATQLNPCIFEYVYFARPDSIINGVQVGRCVCLGAGVRGGYWGHRCPPIAMPRNQTNPYPTTQQQPSRHRCTSRGSTWGRCWRARSFGCTRTTTSTL